MGPLSSQQIPRVHCYLLPKIFWLLSTRLSLSLVHFPKWFDLPWYFLLGWAVFFSLAATWKIEFSFFSSCYLDVSVRRVLLRYGYVFTIGWLCLPQPGFPIRIPRGHCLLWAYPSFRSLTSFIVFMCQGIHLAPFLSWLEILFAI